MYDPQAKTSTTKLKEYRRNAESVLHVLKLVV